jgi:hypothetical protein
MNGICANILGKRILNILNHMIFPEKMQISKPIDAFVFMLDLRMISLSSECEYGWYWKISACSTEYEVCDSFASLTHQQTSYSGNQAFSVSINSHPDNICILFLKIGISTNVVVIKLALTFWKCKLLSCTS